MELIFVLGGGELLWNSWRAAKESDNEMPLGGDNVAVPTDSDVAEYFYQRKLLTVNGMHTTLAFMTLCEDFDAKKELTAELMDGVRAQLTCPAVSSDSCWFALCGTEFRNTGAHSFIRAGKTFTLALISWLEERYYFTSGAVGRLGKAETVYRASAAQALATAERPAPLGAPPGHPAPPWYL